MFSLSEIKPLSSVSPAVSKFKPWWENIIEYLCYGLLALSLLGWTRVSSAQNASLICLLHDQSTMPDFSIRDSIYVNQRCMVEMSRWLLLFYPYMLLFQWFCIFTIQYLWLRLPAVRTRLETFYKLYIDLSSIPATSARPYTSDDINYEGEARETMVALRTKLLWLLHEDSVVYQFYKIKVVVMKVVIFVIISILLYWIVYIGEFDTVLRCDLPSSEFKIAYPELRCNIASGYLLYVLVISNLIMISGIFVLNLHAMSWLFNQRKFRLPHVKTEHWELCKTFEGFKDFRFTLHLLFDDVTNNHHILKVLRFCLSDYLRYVNQRLSLQVGESETHL